MSKEIYKYIFEKFKIPKTERYRHPIRIKLKRDLSDFYYEITGQNDAKDVDEMWDSLSEASKILFLYERKDYLLGYSDSAFHSSINKEIDNDYKRTSADSIKSINYQNQFINIIYKTHYDIFDNKNQAYTEYIKDHKIVAPEISPLSYELWIKSNYGFKDKLLEDPNFKVWKSNNLRFNDWIEKLDNITSNLVKNQPLYDFWKDDNLLFKSWFNQLEFDRTRIYDEIMEHRYLNNLEYNLEHNEGNIHHEYTEKRILEITILTIIKALKIKGISIDYEDIVKTVKYVDNFFIDEFEEIEENDANKLYFRCRNKINNLDFINK